MGHRLAKRRAKKKGTLQSSPIVKSDTRMGKRRRVKNNQLLRNIREINDALEKDPVDMELLRAIGTQNGFISNDLRSKVWPYLLGLTPLSSDHTTPPFTPSKYKRSKLQIEDDSLPLPRSINSLDYDELFGRIKKHKYSDQIVKDVERSLHHFDITKQLKEKHRNMGRSSLHNMMDIIFSLNPQLHYIQGFHDICSVFYLVCGEEQAYFLSQRISLLHLRDTLRPSLEVIIASLSMIFPLLKLSDPELHSFLQQAMVQSFIALPWVLTWFSHNLDNFNDICRLFDFFICSHPLMPIYMAAALMIIHRHRVLSLECDYSYVHQFFQRLSKMDNDVHLLIRTTQNLYERYPLSVLRLEAKVDFPEDSPFGLDDVTQITPFINGTSSPSSFNHSTKHTNGTNGTNGHTHSPKHNKQKSGSSFLSRLGEFWPQDCEIVEEGEGLKVEIKFSAKTYSYGISNGFMLFVMLSAISLIYLPFILWRV